MRILLVGAVSFSGYASLGNLFSQTGVPGEALRVTLYRLAFYVPVSICLIWLCTRRQKVPPCLKNLVNKLPGRRVAVDASSIFHEVDVQ